jgi:hypothetical protein
MNSEKPVTPEMLGDEVEEHIPEEQGTDDVKKKKEPAKPPLEPV